MQVRASVFANLKACARVVVVSSLACSTLAACATTQGAARSESVRLDLHQTAQEFTLVAEQRGWAPKPGAGAMSTLLNGRTETTTATPTEAYLNAKGDLDMESLAKAVMVDIGAAADQTQNLASIAEACAAEKGARINARADLSTVERALIVAKRVRMVLATAVDRMRESLSPRDASTAESRLANLEAQINRLDKTAGDLADRQRGV